jgi:hypothetical protein
MRIVREREKEKVLLKPSQQIMGPCLAPKIRDAKI